MREPPGEKKGINFKAELEKKEDMNRLTTKELCETLLHEMHARVTDRNVLEQHEGHVRGASESCDDGFSRGYPPLDGEGDRKRESKLINLKLIIGNLKHELGQRTRDTLNHKQESKRQAAAVIVERGGDPAEAAKVGMGCCGDQIRNKEDREEAGCGTQMEKTGRLQGRHRRPEKWNGARSIEGAQSTTGGLVMEVGGEGIEMKAEELSRSLHAILGNKAVRIRWCLKKMAELKVIHLDESVQKEELTARVVEAAEYGIMDVRITSTHNGVGDEHRLSEVPPGGGDEDGGKRKNPRRRSSAKIQLTQAKPLRCYKCLQEGHVGAKCPTEPTEIKYFLGNGTGHAAASCGRDPRYEVCAKKGLAADHKVGRGTCAARRNNGNRHGNLATSIRRNGTCVEDLTLANVAARDAIASWEVLEEVESLSDLAYIKSEKNPQSSGGTDCRDDANAEAIKLELALTCVCNVAMRKSRTIPEENIRTRFGGKWRIRPGCVCVCVCPDATARETRARRASRGRGGQEVEEKLRESAKEHKTRKEMVKMTDPWSRPYKILTKKIRPPHRSITETLQENLLRGTINQLFPEDVAERDRELTWSTEDRHITKSEATSEPIIREELDAACHYTPASSKTASGPDGVRMKIIAQAANIIPKERWMPASAPQCIRRRGRRGRLVLLNKPGKVDGTPTSYRPMCLLNDIRKIYQRILGRRLTEFLEQRRTISGRQCGFRRGKSTVDATLELEKSIDIANMLDSIPWREIREAPRRKGVPEYMQKIIGSYLSDRWSEYPIAG
ncbi:UNVERIFIED_CONTAM: hypothetical protein PYX00_011187 [Menopon gallinae]|uniref:CCHC-type domain-containing protein n=1 Tax=Menopon gallinae TaxID=328185 RepID=A0AAW2H6X9_9NEOP